MKITFVKTGWEDYLYWQKTDKKMIKRINDLIKECCRTPFEGTGKPESLKNNLSGWWSRRINIEHRFVYRVENNELIILQCRKHY